MLPALTTMPTCHVSIRLDLETLARVDALVPRFSTKWRAATRSDVLRALIAFALEDFEGASSPPALSSPAPSSPPLSSPPPSSPPLSSLPAAGPV